jgi:hypothetical protein
MGIVGCRSELETKNRGAAASCAGFGRGNPRPGHPCKVGIARGITLVASALPSFLEFPLAHRTAFA